MATYNVISTKDSWLLEALPNTNMGSEVYCTIVGLTGTGNKYNGIFYFDVSGLPRRTGDITSATLSIYYYGHGNLYTTTQNHYINKLTRDNWTESGVTWNKYDGTNSWTAAGGDYTTTNRATAAVDTSEGKWITWDITEITKDAIANVSSHVNLLLTRPTGGYNVDDTYFYTREYSTDTAKRPKLDIVYTPVDVKVVGGVSVNSVSKIGDVAISGSKKISGVSNV